MTTETDLASFGRLPPFALFDEFGVGCDDRVQDHYHTQFARLQAQLDASQAQVVELAELLHRYIAHDRAYDECNGAHMCGSNLHRTAVAALAKVGR